MNNWFSRWTQIFFSFTFFPTYLGSATLVSNVYLTRFFAFPSRTTAISISISNTSCNLFFDFSLTLFYPPYMSLTTFSASVWNIMSLYYMRALGNTYDNHFEDIKSHFLLILIFHYIYTHLAYSVCHTNNKKK